MISTTLCPVFTNQWKASKMMVKRDVKNKRVIKVNDERLGHGIYCGAERAAFA
jgi:hypothetical protein